MRIAADISCARMRVLGWAFAVAAVLAVPNVSAALPRVAFLPFKDNVRLKEAWDLSVDVPRYFSHTVDTIGSDEPVLDIVPFDTVLKLVKVNSWTRDMYLSAKGVKKIAALLRADYVVSGTVTQFQVSKTTLNTDAPLTAGGSLAANTSASGGVTVMGGLQSYSASIALTVDIYSGKTGALQESIPLSTKEKDAGIKMYLPVQRENPEMDFYYMARSPFGSPPFQRSVPGAAMKFFAHSVKRKFQTVRAAVPAPDTLAREYLAGKVVERSGSDVYIDLGSGDRLLQGEVLEVMKPDHPVVNDKGDTLGWAEKRAGSIKVRFVKAQHFSVASIAEESDTIDARCTVRSQVSR